MLFSAPSLHTMDFIQEKFSLSFIHLCASSTKLCKDWQHGKQLLQDSLSQFLQQYSSKFAFFFVPLLVTEGYRTVVRLYYTIVRQMFRPATLSLLTNVTVQLRLTEACHTVKTFAFFNTLLIVETLKVSSSLSMLSDLNEILHLQGKMAEFLSTGT